MREPEHYDGLIDLDCEWRRDVHDSAALSGATASADGTVTYRVYSEGSRTNTAVDLGASDR